MLRHAVQNRVHKIMNQTGFIPPKNRAMNHENRSKTDFAILNRFSFIKKPTYFANQAGPGIT
jgi:hypothetical protein